MTEITKNQYQAMLEPSETKATPTAPSINEVIETAQYSARKAAMDKKFFEAKRLSDTTKTLH